MGTTPTPVNGAATDVNEIIQFTIFTVALDALKTYLVGTAPWLSWPVISQIFSGILNYFAGWIYKYLAQIATINIIDFQVDSEVSAYAQAEAALRQANESGDPNAIATATANFKTTLASLIHWDGSATT